MAAIRIIIAFVCLLVHVYCGVPAAPPAFAKGNAYGTGTGQNCRYEFTVPDKAGMCNRGNAALDDKIEKVKEDLDRTRLQYVSQNTILQDQMSKIQNNANSYASQINELYSHIRQIENQMATQPSSQGPGASELQKLLQTTKDNFNKALQDMENRLFNITYSFQKDAIEQSKVNAAVEMQVRLQEEKTKNAEENIKDLLKMVNSLQSNPVNPVTTARTGGATPAVLNDVRNRLKNFEEEIRMYDQLQQDQFSALQLKTNSLSLQLSNHSHQLNDLATETNAMMFRVSNTQKQATRIRSDLDDFQAVHVPKINTLVDDMLEVKANTTKLLKQLNSVASKAMNADIHSLNDAASIQDLKTRVTLLSARITDVLGKLTNQSTTIKTLSSDLDSLSSTLDPTQLQAMQAALQRLKATGTIGAVTQNQLEQVETEIQKLDKVVQSLVKAPPALVVPTLPHTNPTTPQPFVIPTTKLPFVVPTAHKPLTTQPPFIVPTLKPVKLGEVTSKPFVVPTLPFQTPKLIVPTLPPMVVPTLPRDNKK